MKITDACKSLSYLNDMILNALLYNALNFQKQILENGRQIFEYPKCLYKFDWDLIPYSAYTMYDIF